MRRKILALCLMALLVVAISATAQGANLTKTIKAVYRNIAIVIDSKVNVPSEEPFIVDGHVYVPLRYISEALGAQVHWDNSNSRVVIATAAKSDPTLEQAKWQEGFNAGLAQGQLLSSKSVDKAYDEGYEKGFEKGKKEGYDDGYEDGYDKAGRSSSRRGDYRDGEDDGYEVGYEDGEYAAEKANDKNRRNLNWKEALEEYIGIEYKYADEDIIDEHGRYYDLNFRRYPEYTEGFIDGYLDGFEDAYKRYL